MQIIETEIPDVKIILPKKQGDIRGFFSETYNKKDLTAAGLHFDFVQDNHSLSPKVGTIRGLHFQIPPFTLDKLVRVTKGSVFDVVVDLRKNSPTFGKHITALLSAEKWNQILVPIGFAHGFCTLEPNTEVLYKVTNYYSPEHDQGILWNDPELGIKWPIKREEAIVSEKDQKNPNFSENLYYF